MLKVRVREFYLTVKQRRWLADNHVVITRKWWKRLKCGVEPIRIEPYCSFEENRHLWTMGSFSYCHSNLPAGSTVGRYCSIAINLWVMGLQHPLTRFTSSPITYHPDIFGLNGALSTVKIDEPKPITIKNDVWIGQNVTIKPGVTIGNGAVIGAHSLVTKDVPDYAVVGGIPAKVIKYRFDEATVEELLALQWWQYSCLDFSDIAMDEDIREFIAKLKEKIASGKIEQYIPRPLVI